LKQEPQLDAKEYKVNYAFGMNDKNEAVNNEISVPLVDLALDLGFSSIFCYGQTGSGKTHTIQGLQ
jgi:kinesin family protein 2/24